MELSYLNWKSFFLMWSTFFLFGSIASFTVYFPVCMKLLGLTPSQIGLTSLFGVHSLAMPIIGFVTDKFRARKFVLGTSSVLLVLLSLVPLLSLVAPALQHCDNSGGNYSKDDIITTHSQYTLSGISHNKGDHLLSLLLFAVIIRQIYEALASTAMAVQTTAVLTHVKEDKAKYGYYHLWAPVGVALISFIIGIGSSYVGTTICASIQHGYFINFPVTSIAMALSLIALHWMDYEYLEDRVINWHDVKVVVFDIHYMVVLFVGFYTAWVFSFQYQWEFWYLDQLSAGPTLLGVAGFIRYAFVALWFLASVPIIRKMGDLKSMALALFTYSSTMLALTFFKAPWLIVFIDIVQSLGFALPYTCIPIHLMKAGNKASSAAMIALFELVWRIGLGWGVTVTGWLFHRVGPRTTFISYTISTSIVLVLFLGYLYSRRNLEDYENVADTDEEDTEEDEYK